MSQLHPPEETLLTFASGEADLPLRVLVEAHLAACPACAAVVVELRAAGGRLLAALPETAVEDGLWERLRGRLDREPAPPAALDSGDSAIDLPVPPAALAELPALRPLRWRWAWAPDARLALVARDPGTHSMLLAARMPGARSFPRHLHVGPEDVVVVTGGYDDHLGRYEAGNYAAYAPGTSHRPHTEPDEGCAILLRLEKPNRFYGWRGVLQGVLG
jgi:putative transcriptional regulator